MARLDDITSLLEVADELFEEIQTEYDQSLEAQDINPKLAVNIKNYLENLRSSLDYLATEICEQVLSLPKSHKTYFPVACKNKKAFLNFTQNNFPGLDKANSPLHSALETLQHYNPGGCESIAKLSKLVNENKHKRLSTQTRTEERGLNIEFPGGAGISMGPGASISGGGIISSGGGWISPAGGTISGDSPAQVGESIQQTVVKWISFTFKESGDNVLDLLKKCREDVEKIVAQVKPYL
ncbi:hypothetical protein MYX82_03860 [Acidobacteria bacterium AH-259-D05]|nr:hypothetical protein [Acidobacteria bacterium AH-259-D05]